LHVSTKLFVTGKNVKPCIYKMGDSWQDLTVAITEAIKIIVHQTYIKRSSSLIIAKTASVTLTYKLSI